MLESGHGIGPTGRYSPLRYPGGKGKLSKFMTAVVRANGLSDGRYIEPYAGGAGIAWELLITGVVRRVLINDISPQLFAFWESVLQNTDELCRRIWDVPLSVEEWDRQKAIFLRPENASTLELGISCFYLNRTNRSGIPEWGAHWWTESGREMANGCEVQPKGPCPPNLKDRRLSRPNRSELYGRGGVLAGTLKWLRGERPDLS